ncbi:MAG: GHKL domain-containing protein [Desulfomonile tiedjei]|uniref:histidine kinase n=1 Tax=Desulfomonile tiedjei TaxID=2358 RepID=A0A9D6V3W4_9BACT|nr:GHKL domain-containing protein [Desulfomonile tiedjei]
MASKHYRSLRLKIVFVTLFFSLIPLFALGVTIYYLFATAYNSKNSEGLRTLAETRRSAVELFFDERISQLITIANTHSLDTLQDEANLKRVFDIMQARSKSFIDLGVIDEEGKHLAYVGPHYDELKVVNYAHEEWFQAVRSSGVYVSDIFLGFRKVPHFIIAVTRLEKNRTWILRATINSEIIESIVREGIVGKRGDGYIVNRNNVLQTTPRFSGKLLGRPDGPDLSSIIGLQLELVRTERENNLFAAAPIRNPKWVLVLREDLFEQMGPLFQAQYAGGLILAAGILLVITGTVLTSRSMIKELIRMEVDKAKSDDLVMQSSKMAALGKMAAGIAHEINNPLAIIGEKAGWMKDLLDKEDIQASENFKEFEDCIKKIERQVERSRTITHRLLRFGRRMEPTQDMVDINTILAETLTFLEGEAHYRDIKIVSNYDKRLPRITTDSAQLQQVFLNIVDNAIDAVGKSGIIEIETGYDQARNSDIFIRIKDNGPGISKELIGKIFDPFFSTKVQNEGTGLGLSISYSIIEKLGGKITVQSEEGKGTTFVIFVPVR